MALDRDRLMRDYAPRLAWVPRPQERQEAQEAQDVEESLSSSATSEESAAVANTVTTTSSSSASNSTVVASATTASTTATGGTLWSPVVTTIGTRTLLTAPATTERAAMWDGVPNPNPHMLWMQGRFVGAERPNRNGALWSVSDLELGQATVAHGPLNWLHQDRHVIGVIADAQMVPSRTQQVALPEAAAMGGSVQKTVAEAHLTALSGIWRWLYPEEASVVEMASEAGMLAYSMECIAENIQCVRDEAADSGCGKSYPYIEYAKGQVCDHLRERSSVRRLVNPTFLGGAVIVPPTRPGWADADASVLGRVSAMAEKAFEEAGQPDIPAAQWEQMMSQVVRFAEQSA